MSEYFKELRELHQNVSHLQRGQDPRPCVGVPGDVGMEEAEEGGLASALPFQDVLLIEGRRGADSLALQIEDGALGVFAGDAVGVCFTARNVRPFRGGVIIHHDETVLCLVAVGPLALPRPDPRDGVAGVQVAPLPLLRRLKLLSKAKHQGRMAYH